MDTVAMLKQVAHNLYTTAISGGSKAANDVANKILKPRPGDLVLEVSSFYTAPIGEHHNIGKLLRVEQWPVFPGEHYPTKRVWIIELTFAGGGEFSWENANFIRVLTEPVKML